MGVYKRKLAKGIRWYFSGQFQGQKYFSKAMFLTRAECLMAERDRLQQIETEINTQQPESEIMLVDVMSARLDEIKANHSNRYYKETQRYYRILLKYLGNIPVETVRKVQINKFIFEYSKQVQERGSSNYCTNAMLRSVKALFNYAIRIYDIEMRNPFVGIKLFPVDIKLKFIPSEQEIAYVRSALDNEERFLFDFVEQTGCRISEALRLKFEDIQEGLVTLWTRKAKNSNLTPRRIPVPECLKNIQGKGCIFGRWKDKPKFLERYIRKLGLKKWSWHNLRHRRASLWAQEGRTLLEIMQLLGHSNLSTTQKYLQILGHIKL